MDRTPASNTSYPLLVTDVRSGGKRDKLAPNFGGGYSGPGAARQGQRLGARFANLTSAMQRAALEISTQVGSREPELVVVFEIIGSLDEFRTAVKNTPGLEFLGEFDDEPLESDPDFEGADQKLSRSLYILAQSRKAQRAILSLWGEWQADESKKFPIGLNGWRRVFSLMRDVREWSPSDRVDGSHFDEVWGDVAGDSLVHAEVEFWFRDSPRLRRTIQEHFGQLAGLAQARVLDSIAIGEIAYHAVLLEFPRSVGDDILALQSPLVRDSSVSRIRPQSIVAAVTPRAAEENFAGTDEPAEPPEGDPFVALLDGNPLVRHELLSGRVAPSPGAGSLGPSAHGTAMASAIIWGDLARSDAAPLRRVVLSRPVITHASVDRRGQLVETMDPSRLHVAVIREALEEVLGSSADPVRGGHPRIVAIAVGHTLLPFGTEISPFARLLDWYSERYGVLFVVSAGNYFDPIELASTGSFADAQELQRAVLRHLVDTAARRRLLAPAEGMNVLTVGAVHKSFDETGKKYPGLDPLASDSLPSPISAVGAGYGRSVKPDLFAPGGRVLYRQRLGAEYFTLDRSLRPDADGVVAASVDGVTERVTVLGTSAATGLVAHEAAQVAELLRFETEGGVVSLPYIGVATKALLLNSATWHDAPEHLAEVLDTDQDLRPFATRYLGYGVLRDDAVAIGSPDRVTVLGVGAVAAESSQVLDLPIPVSLNGLRVWRRVSATLAWFTPINVSNRQYRVGRLWFGLDNPNVLGLSRREAEWRAARRGSSQHEVFEGSTAAVISSDTFLRVRVNCAAQAARLANPVRFALALTIETAPGTAVPLHNDVSVALRSRTTVRDARVRS